MTVIIQGRQLDITEALRQHVNERLKHVHEKFFGDGIDTTVTISRAGNGFHTHISAHVIRSMFVQAQSDAESAYIAVDIACENLTKQLSRYKQRLQNHRRRNVTAEPAWYSVLSPEAETGKLTDSQNLQPTIVAEMEAKIDTLTVSEAVMRLDLANLSALLFRNHGHGQLNMVYRRADGNIGWVDPDGNKKAANPPAPSPTTAKKK